MAGLLGDDAVLPAESRRNLLKVVGDDRMCKRRILKSNVGKGKVVGLKMLKRHLSLLSQVEPRQSMTLRCCWAEDGGSECS